MDNDSEFLKDWDLLASASKNGQNVDHEDHIEENQKESSSKVTENESLIQNSGIQDIDQDILNESSSSDIDVIDENVDEFIPSCVLPSSSLSISPTIEKSLSTSTESSSVYTTLSPENVTSTENTENSDTPVIDTSASNNERGVNDSWIIGGRSVYDWLYLLLEFIQNMSGLEWGVVLAVTMLLYVNITIHQTNQIGLQKEEVLSQMKKIIDELKHDNKVLKDQMLSEIQNDKVISSFEHQIQDLKKENSKLNHMLKDVVTVLQRQKDSQEKLFQRQEAEYQAPFKNEINKLKEHINMLKFDNEELQKQLVRMRYASYSQGSKHSDGKDKHYEKKKEREKSHTHTFNENKADTGKNFDKQATDSKEKITDTYLDIEQLENWNNLIALLAKELGISGGKEETAEETATSNEKTTKTEVKYDWGWKILKTKFDFPNVNISDFVSKYMKYNVQTMSGFYDKINKYFSSAQENAQEVLKSFQKSEEDSEMLKFLKSMKKYWGDMKNHYLKTFIKKGHQSTDDTPSSESNEDLNTKSDFQSSKENFQQESEKLSDANNFESNDKADSNANRWLFKRAEYRAKNRQKDESSINWFLRRGKEFFKGKASDEENDLFVEE